MPIFFVGEPFNVSFFSGIENVLIRGGGGVSRFSVENNLSHSAEKVRRGTFPRFTNFGNRKSFKKVGGIKILRRKFFCLTLPRKFVGKLFSVSIISGIETV